MTAKKNRARQGCTPCLALTLNSETTPTLKAGIMLSDFNKVNQYKQLFDLKKLPTPVSYFNGLKYQFRGNGIWRMTTCPFHEDSKPSLAVHIEKGAFKCFSCGAKGGDVLAFHRQLHNLSFVDACKDLGAWGAL